MEKIIKPKKNLNFTITVPGDKSISHRSVMLGSIASGKTEVFGFLNGADCLSTISCFKKLGVKIEVDGTHVTIYGNGIKGLLPPTDILDVGNSGTTLRLISGLLSAQPFESILTGDSSIQKRPMDRVAIPLKKMGANIKNLKNDNPHIYAPIKIKGQNLTGIEYILPVASAQVKSAIILAGLYANSDTIIIEPETTRDHTEIMLNYLGANIDKIGNKIICHPINELYGKKIYVPSDISSAAYFIVAGLICENSHIILKNVGINPTRTGIITVLKNMGGNINILNEHSSCGELIGDIEVKTSKLKATTIGGKIIPLLIDEIPIIAVAACFAEGKTVIKNAEELKVKESNRIKVMTEELSKMGADITETDDGMVINGGKQLKGSVSDSHNDHRIAMSITIAALCAYGETKINDAQCVDISFPNFYDYFK